MDVGCYQPAIGYYAALGWREVIGIAKEEGECNTESEYRTAEGAIVRNLILDVETELIPEQDRSVDVMLMMEVFEHFGLDPFHALAEANRVLKQGGLLVFTTPNAASFSSLRRLANGRSPFAGLEFSGFSTNRHNRIYDAAELQAIISAAGFTIELCTSRTYRVSSPGLRTAAFEALWKCIDSYSCLRTGQQTERGDYLMVRARKSGPILERYPPALYFDRDDWPDWFKAIQKKM
jgi:2-polyprenyl-3-methyl-5-hydroxy-6-metoxy-1,4-benzoquinol methylase